VTTERFEEIVSRYADGAATPEELAELERLMRDDPALRRSFVERMRLEVALCTLSEASMEAEKARSSSRRGVRGARPLSPAGSNHPALAAWIAAAAVLVAPLLYAVFAPRAVPVDRTAHVPLPEDPAIAVRTEDRRKAEEEKARAEAERKQVEERLMALRRQEGDAAREREREEQLEARRRAEEALRLLQAEREAAEARLREADERERRALEEVTRVVVKETPVRPPSVTAVAAARLDRVEGEVYVTGRAGRKVATPGQDLLAGEGVACAGARSFAVLSFPDKSRLELQGRSVIRDLGDVDPAARKGKRVFVEKGGIKADIVAQPKDLPLTVGSPQAELKVLGTTFRLTVDADPKSGSVLEVEEGRIELRTPAGKTVDVAAGRMAVAAAGTIPAVRALPKEETVLWLDFEDGKKPSLVSMGTVERGPERPGNRLCAAGIEDPRGVSKMFIGEDALGLFTIQGDEVLSFDYWADTDTAQLNFNFYARNRGLTFEGAVAKPVQGKWSHASIRLSELGTPASRLRPEDWVVGLYLQATGPAAKRFYVDNLQVTRSRTLKPRPSEAKK
jgi:ferric-dicitrate binding protein FerR (iron transport regulator)